MQVSVIIPSCGRIEMLARCLAAVNTQDLGLGSYEVIIVDDSTDGRVAAWAAHLLNQRSNLRCLRTSGGCGPATARNLGSRHARAPILAFTDDDTVPLNSWLKEGLGAFQPDVIAVTGSLVVPTSCPPTDYELNEAGLARAEFVTANCFVRREVFESLNGFDERFKAAWREDSDLHFRLLELSERTGTRLLHAKNAVVIHPVRPAPWGISLQQQKKAMYNALLYKNHPSLYRQRIQNLPPLLYYSIVAAGLVACWAGRSPAGLAAAFTWAGLTGHFVFRRLRWTSKRPWHVAEMVITSVFIPFLSVFWRVRGGWRFRVLFF